MNLFSSTSPMFPNATVYFDISNLSEYPAISVFSFASCVFSIILLLTILEIVSPANINNNMIVITNATNVIPLLRLYGICLISLSLIFIHNHLFLF